MCACGNEVAIKKTQECRPCYMRRYNYRYKREVLGYGKPRAVKPKPVSPEGRTLLKVVDLHRPITYVTAHTRLMNWRGPAKQHACIDCGEQAAQWSYNHQGRHEMRGTKVNPWGQLIKVRWSTEVADYDPRCIACHNKIDREARLSPEKVA